MYSAKRRKSGVQLPDRFEHAVDGHSSIAQPLGLPDVPAESMNEGNDRMIGRVLVLHTGLFQFGKAAYCLYKFATVDGRFNGFHLVLTLFLLGRGEEVREGESLALHHRLSLTTYKGCCLSVMGPGS